MDNKYGACMSKNGKDNNNTREIYRRVNLVRNDEKYTMHKIHWCEVFMQLAEIATKNVRENDLNNRIKYIMVRLEN